ncbi:MAG: beta-ketoacyl-[acyl-carrier-protein] synthase family protein [Candidatus Omnitrophota bacterium]|nr:beta-ketoacyl-[acyl-carrier-protein] synthase family protein [Candidatus Omnitrophota bacterium]
MAAKVIVITGVGVICSNGTGKDAFSSAITEGVSGIKPITIFDTSAYTAKTAGEVANFDPQQFLGAKGLRTLDRTTRLATSAAKLALDDARLEVSEENCRDIGVVLGSTLGSVKSVCDFDKDALKDGPRYVNPAFFANTVINSPASQISIKFNIRGFNSTISTGFSAGVDALGYAVDMLRAGRAKIALAGGAEEFCLETFLGFYKSGLLAGRAGSPEISCPFDRRRNGVVLGEAAAILVLEGLDSALERKAAIYGRISGYGTGFAPSGSRSLRRAMQGAIGEAGIQAADINYISAAGNSSLEQDAAEAEAINEVFAQDAQNVLVSSIKSMTGECYSASGALQTAAALGAIDKQMAPPMINYAQLDPACRLNYVVNKAKSCKIDNVLINTAGCGWASSSLVISKFKR